MQASGKQSTPSKLSATNARSFPASRVEGTLGNRNSGNSIVSGYFGLHADGRQRTSSAPARPSTGRYNGLISSQRAVRRRVARCRGGLH
jgi:hypothetical protein